MNLKQSPISNVEDHQIQALFPTPLYVAKRNTEIDTTEKKEIDKTIEEGMYLADNWTTHNTYIFNDGRLKKIKRFIDKHIKIYVKEILAPKQEANFYITQSWLSITKPGEYHGSHLHKNSLISGTFYISTNKTDRLMISDPNVRIKEFMNFIPEENTVWNSSYYTFPIENNLLFLFPSWIIHNVPANMEASSVNRITIAFNTFAKGTFGEITQNDELIL